MTSPYHTELFHIDQATGCAFAIYEAEWNQISIVSYEFQQCDANVGARRRHRSRQRKSATVTARRFGRCKHDPLPPQRNPR